MSTTGGIKGLGGSGGIKGLSKSVDRLKKT